MPISANWPNTPSEKAVQCADIKLKNTLINQLIQIPALGNCNQRSTASMKRVGTLKLKV